MSYSLNLNQDQINLLISTYNNYTIEHTNNYTLFRAKYKTTVLTIFKTSTLLIQGRKDREVYIEICDLLNLEPILKEISDNESLTIDLSLIGTDEVGTGDFFGGIVVAAAYVPNTSISKMKKLGIRDSKELTDDKIMEIAPIIAKEIKYSINLLENVKFNYLTQVRGYNMNKIKAMLHNSVINNLIQKIDKYDGIVIDAFTTEDKYFDYLKDEKNVIYNVKLEEKAENKYVAVATASILARYVFLNHMNSLSNTIGFDLPKGASNKIDVAIERILRTKNSRFFSQIAKTSFKNFDKYRD